MISSASSSTLAQILVPTSTIDWCISRLTWSPNAGALEASSSDTCERSSQLCGSTIWNSSSTPTVNACSIFRLSSATGRRLGRRRTILDHHAADNGNRPARLRERGRRAIHPFDRHLLAEQAHLLVGLGDGDDNRLDTGRRDRLDAAGTGTAADTI